jgi:hypothetical protein
MAKVLPVDHPNKAGLVYASSKTQAELAAWAFVKENKVRYFLHSLNLTNVLITSLVRVLSPPSF